jgi:Zn-finger nucleic acid-binding protein
MPEREPRMSCPVCLGVQLTKLSPSANVDLTLDYCGRCGGIWFDKGEVERLRQCRPHALYTRVQLRPDVYHMKCPECGASVERNAPRCPACHRENTLQCPRCERRMRVVFRDELRLDLCQRCRGLWFDNVELARIWNTGIETFADHHPATRKPDTRQDDYFLLDHFVWVDTASHPVASPGPTPVGEVDVGSASGEGGGGGGGGGLLDAAGSLFHGIGEAAGTVWEKTGDLAGSVFEGISDAVSGAWDAIGDAVDDVDLDFD